MAKASPYPNNKTQDQCEVKCCFIKRPIFPSPLKEFEYHNEFWAHDNLEKARLTRQLIGISETRLLRTWRPSVQILKSLSSPVVVNRYQVHVRIHVHISSKSVSRLVFKIGIVVIVVVVIVFGMNFDKGFVDTNTFGIRMPTKTDSGVSNNTI